MRRKLFVAGVVVVIGVGLLVATRSASAPPDHVQPIAWNEEACAHCGMLIGDPRFAAQLVTTSGDVRSFDDPGCAVSYIDARHPEIHRLWFHHGERDEWLVAERAGFVSMAHTPMESGLMAVEHDRPGALDLTAAARRMELPVTGRELCAAARLELAAIRRSKWLWFCVLVYALFGIVLMTAGDRESTLLGFTGTSRVLLSLSHALVLVLPLIALIATAPVVQRARDDGTLELLLAQPLSPGTWFVAAFATRYLALVLPLAATFVIVGASGSFLHGDPVPWSFAVRALAIAAALIAAFAGIGACISVFVRDPARVITYLILVWVAGIALIDFGLIGMLLRWKVEPRLVFGLAAANPVESARLALVSHLQPDLSTFGPVGFYLATRLGSGMLFAIGILWPAVVGAIGFAIAYVGFRRTDRV